MHGIKDQGVVTPLKRLQGCERAGDVQPKDHEALLLGGDDIGCGTIAGGVGYDFQRSTSDFYSSVPGHCRPDTGEPAPPFLESSPPRRRGIHFGGVRGRGLRP